MSRPSRRTLLLGLGTALAGCTAPQGDETTTAETGPGGTVRPASTSVGYPHVRGSGNRVLAGAGSLPDATPIEHSLSGTPVWITAVPTNEGSTWAVVDLTDTLSLLGLRDGAITVDATDSWPAARPAVLRRTVDGAVVATPPPGTGTVSPTLVLDDGLATVAEDGTVVFTGGGARRTVAADLLPDARLCRLDERRAVAPGGPTTSYDHGALGDGVEASEIVVLTLGDPAVERRISVPDGRVIEGIAPIVTDLGGDRAIVVTETDASDGARLAAYAADGTRLAGGDPIGSGFRWRHQLAVAPFGPRGERELAVVKTPHIGGTVEFYRRRGDSLDIVATLDGASSHAYGSRNLDGAVAADFDGDGRTELLVPNDARTELRGVERRAGRAVEEWSIPLDATLSSNLLAVRHGDSLAVAAGTGDGVLRVWS